GDVGRDDQPDDAAGRIVGLGHRVGRGRKTLVEWAHPYIVRRVRIVGEPADRAEERPVTFDFVVVVFVVAVFEEAPRRAIGLLIALLGERAVGFEADRAA